MSADRVPVANPADTPVHDEAVSSKAERAEIGMCFDRTFPAEEITAYARDLEANDIEQLWLIEDCFFTTGVSLAAAALATTERLRVGIGIVPAVIRTAALTAMEFATLANLGAGRFIGGIGHGVQEWMEQMGVRPASPLTALEETIDAVRRLLDGEEVTVDGQYVTLDRVRLHRPPATRPLLYAGVQQQRSMVVAGRVADGLLLTECSGAAYVRWALDHAAADRPLAVSTFTMFSVDDDRRTAYSRVAPFVANMVEQRRPGLRVLPFYDELVERVDADGAAALLEMPADYWTAFAAVGTLDDALAHIGDLEAAGVSGVNIFPADDMDIARQLIPAVGELARR